MSTQQIHLWLRDETKPHERRSALTPKEARALVADGFRVTVEASEVRMFSDTEFLRAGAKLAPAGSWRQAPLDAIILGLKELPAENTPLSHRHIYFAHCYKNQTGWKDTLSRFRAGGGALLDLEYLVDDAGRRVAAFGRWAGFAGAAVGVDLWCQDVLEPGSTRGALRPYLNQEALVSALRARVDQAVARIGRKPRTIVLGAKGRCGRGAIDLLSSVGLEGTITAWDKEETACGGPFPEILDHDIFVNCVLLSGNIAPFLTREMLDWPRRLSVVSDVSCDPTSPHNPVPIYEKTTTFAEPSTRLRAAEGVKPALVLTAIDHLPSLLPRESSEDFASQLLPHLRALKTGSPVWERAAALYLEHASLLEKGEPS